jgi:uncharacterized protein (TIGR02300 family)
MPVLMHGVAPLTCDQAARPTVRRGSRGSLPRASFQRRRNRDTTPNVQHREYPMTKPELGTKRRCNSCATKFFDLNNDPIVCPKCMAVFVPPQPDPVRSRRQSERQASPMPKDAAPTVPNEIASLDGTTADQKTKSLAKPEAEEDLLLTDDQDGDIDPTEVLGADLGKNDDT